MPDESELTFDQLMRQQYARLNLPELRELARLDGKMVPTWASRWEIIDVLLGNVDPPKSQINSFKETFMHYLEENKSFLDTSLLCDGNCKNHPTELFLLCLSRSGQARNHFHDVRGGKDHKPRT